MEIEIVTGVVSLIIGVIIGRYLVQKVYSKMEMDAIQKAKSIENNALLKSETLKEKRILEAKEIVLKLKIDFNNESNNRKNQLINFENKLKQQESRNKQQESKLKQKNEQFSKQQEQLKRKNIDLDKRDEDITRQLEVASKKQKKAESMLKMQISQLEKIANLSAKDAKLQLVEALKDEAKNQASVHIKQIIDEAKLTANKKAKKLIISSIQRTAAEQTIENCVSIFNLESDKLKGKIIGREGRNIRTLEASIGVEIVVDDTPEAIIISGHDPVRREIARLALHKLVSDGRIHPGRIEEVVKKTQKNIENEIVELGERTVVDLGIHGLHPELIRMVGRMRYRSSYGQNLLQHSKEVARLSATLAAELGLNTKKAKRAGLLHDIGKVWSEEPELPHAILGMNLAEKYGESKEICNAIGAHHDEIEMTFMISPIIQACDAISGSRPGARREMMEAYMKRLKDIESMGMAFEGVKKCFAMQAGRELRIMVDSESISDKSACQLSFDLSQKIEKEMQYPGQIKVTVIREMRAVNYAK